MLVCNSEANFSELLERLVIYLVVTYSVLLVPKELMYEQLAVFIVCLVF